MERVNISGEEPIAQRILDAVAEKEGTSPREFHQPLYDVVDADALDRLVDGKLNGHVQFQYLGYRVTVDGDGAISVTEPSTE